MRRLLALALIAGVVIGCDPAPSPASSTRAGPTPRPSFPAAGSPANLSPDQIRAELMPLMGTSGLSIGEGARGIISVNLRANAEGVAREIVAKYGSAVEVTVGNFAYPPPEARSRSCLWLPQVVIDHRPLQATLSIQRTVIGGDFFKGTLRLTNAGVVPYELLTSSGFTVYLFRQGETEPIASSEGAVAGTGYGRTLVPGEGVDLGAGGGTASCDLAVGYVIPAGTYIGRALVDYQEPVTFENRVFWSDAAPIEVVEP